MQYVDVQIAGAVSVIYMSLRQAGVEPFSPKGTEVPPPRGPCRRALPPLPEPSRFECRRGNDGLLHEGRIPG